MRVTENPSDFFREYELKFLFPRSAYMFVHNYLEAVLNPDEFSSSRNFTLNYDTPELKAFQEKRYSEISKTKVRLRWYLDTATGKFSDKVYLEVKRRRANLRNKSRTPVDRDAALLTREMTAGRLDSREYATPSFSEPELFDDRKFPIVCSSYSRKRFLCRTSAARVNLDSDLRIEAVDPTVVGPSATGAPSLDMPVIVEVKGTANGIPAELAGLLGRPDQFGFSKYEYIINNLCRLDRSEGIADEWI